jgi:hypothetical protein
MPVVREKGLEFMRSPFRGRGLFVVLCPSTSTVALRAKARFCAALFWETGFLMRGGGKEFLFFGIFDFGALREKARRRAARGLGAVHNRSAETEPTRTYLLRIGL